MDLDLCVLAAHFDAPAVVAECGGNEDVTFRVSTTMRGDRNLLVRPQSRLTDVDAQNPQQRRNNPWPP